MIRSICSLGFLGWVRLFFNVLLSRSLFRGCRVVRWPFYIRRVGKLVLGAGFSSGPGLIIDVLDKSASVSVGCDVYANYRLHIGAKFWVEIGDNCLFGSDCLIIDHNHGRYIGDFQSYPSENPVDRILTGGGIKIGSNCWFGDRVTVLPGVTIGSGVVVGVGAVVTHDLPSDVIAVGAPAKVIKRFDHDSGVWKDENDVDHAS